MPEPSAAHRMRASTLQRVWIRTVRPSARGRDLVVGDVHGCFRTLDGALCELRFDTDSDRLFGVGDLVDRGPHSAEALALRFAFAQSQQACLAPHRLDPSCCCSPCRLHREVESSLVRPRVEPVGLVDLEFRARLAPRGPCRWCARPFSTFAVGESTSCRVHASVLQVRRLPRREDGAFSQVLQSLTQKRSATRSISRLSVSPASLVCRVVSSPSTASVPSCQRVPVRTVRASASPSVKPA